MPQKPLPYGKQWISDEDIGSVVEVLRSEWLTTGPKVHEFEEAFAAVAGTREAVAVSNGTAALHCAMYALGIGPGDEVIVPAMTFAATANCVVYQGGTPVFADVRPEDLLLDPESVESRITPNTRAVIAVDYAGHPCDYAALRRVTERRGLALVADACHAIGGSYRGKPVGSLADLSTFSFHPVKHITTGEGGAISTDDTQFASRMRTFRNHGITSDHRQRAQQGTWFYEMVALGYNYRLTDFQCALGLAQLKHLQGWVARRQQIARCYDTSLTGLSSLTPLRVSAEVNHAYHLYVVQLKLEGSETARNEVFAKFREAGIGVQVHYIPVHLHPFYRERFQTAPGLCPIAEAAYQRILSLPIFPAMDDRDVERVIEVAHAVCTPA